MSTTFGRIPGARRAVRVSRKFLHPQREVGPPGDPPKLIAAGMGRKRTGIHVVLSCARCHVVSECALGPTAAEAFAEFERIGWDGELCPACATGSEPTVKAP